MTHEVTWFGRDPDRPVGTVYVRRLTGWDVFADDADRVYVSRLWAEDWDAPEDAVYDEDDPPKHGEFCEVGGPCCACERCGQWPCPVCGADPAPPSA